MWKTGLNISEDGFGGLVVPSSAGEETGTGVPAEMATRPRTGN